MMMMPDKVKATRFLDVALSKKGPCSVSYHDLKWLIRKDLLALLRDFPSLSLCAIPTSPPSSITTSTVNLLAASGPLLLPSQQPLHLTIILHPSHPLLPPFVFVAPPYPSSTPFSTRSLLHNPFVDTLTGSTTTPYLLAWQHPTSNLPDLARNLVNIFTFWPVNCPGPLWVRPHRVKTTVSLREAIDRLSMQLLSDMVSFVATVEEDMDALNVHVKPMLSRRSAAFKEAVQALEDEATTLRSTVEAVTKAAAEVEEWLSSCASNLKGFFFFFRFHHEPREEEEKQEEEEEDAAGDDNNKNDRVLDAFHGADERSEQMLEHYAADRAIDDVMMVLEKELDRGAVRLGDYLKEIRVLAKEQFYHIGACISSSSVTNSPCLLVQKIY